MRVLLVEDDADLSRQLKQALGDAYEWASEEAGRYVPDRPLLHLCEVAHRECFIANSLSSDIVVEPTFDIRSGGR